MARGRIARKYFPGTTAGGDDPPLVVPVRTIRRHVRRVRRPAARAGALGVAPRHPAFYSCYEDVGPFAGADSDKVILVEGSRTLLAPGLPA